MFWSRVGGRKRGIEAKTKEELGSSTEEEEWENLYGDAKYADSALDEDSTTTPSEEKSCSGNVVLSYKTL